MSIAKIYKITNKINNKAYVGFTKKPIDEYWDKRCYLAEKGYDKSQTTGGRFIMNAIRKYGKDNFTMEIIYVSYDVEHTFEVMEEHFIRQFKTHWSEGGYNLTYGGSGQKGLKHKRKSRQKMRKSQKGTNNGFHGKHHNEETKWKCGARTRGKTYENIYGSEKANEIKQKQSKLKKGKPAWNKGISVKQEIRNKIRETIKKNKNNNKVFRWWKITLPDGIVHITKDRRQFCEEHDLNYNTVNDYSQKQKPYRGYYFEKTLPPTHFGN